MGNQDYSVKQLLQLEACTRCLICAEVCPAVMASSDGRLSAVHRIEGLKEIVRDRTDLWRRVLRRMEPAKERLDGFSETVFRCTLCGNCREACPVGIDLRGLWISLRRDLVGAGSYPKKIDMIRENLEGSRNVFGEDQEERAEWVDDVRDPPDHGYIRDRAEVVYFTGCVAAYFPMAQKIPTALTEILEAGGVEFTLLGEDEWCCGFPLLGAGLKDTFRELRDHNIEAVKRKGAREVVFACPSCYQMWREHYPRGVGISHATQFLLKLVREQRLRLKDVDLTVAYHDPCDLGRGARVFDEPRALLRSIPGLKMVEPPRNREESRCCGGGGNLEMMDAELSAEIARQRIEEIVSTGAGAVVTSCQQCVRTLTTYVRRNKVPIEVMDITQLVDRALEK